MGVQMAELPAGTVTFLFTDIEGSTRWWIQQPAVMRQVLLHQNAVIAAAIESHGGYGFNKVGDQFCAAFSSARDATQAAVDAQSALYAEMPQLRVRMALHTGSAELIDGDYFGAPLNRVARLTAAAHGGQTLVSDEAYDACKNELPRDVRVKLLGVHTLKGVPERTAVFQLCHPDLQESFPALTGSAIDDTQSIAVLPFVNLSGDPGHQVFAR